MDTSFSSAVARSRPATDRARLSGPIVERDSAAAPIAELAAADCSRPNPDAAHPVSVGLAAPIAMGLSPPHRQNAVCGSAVRLADRERISESRPPVAGPVVAGVQAAALSGSSPHPLWTPFPCLRSRLEPPGCSPDCTLLSPLLRWWRRRACMRASTAGARPA
ncbi:hypothetical protein COCOBI_03-3170 [Coccomyxa sp. Obi]|nr:hypothetical protein COCOBI_03-3170 [Coccomyxa sp. Obi]